MTNKILGRLVDRVFVTYPDKEHAFPAERTVRLGNPIRGGIAAAVGPHDASRRHLLVLGGSQGARAVNDAVLAILPGLLDAGIKVRLQAGQADFDRVGPRAAEVLAGRTRSGAEPELVIENFIEDMAEAYGWADLVLARSGASTLAEATAAGKPSILIPFPFATHDHQAVNAAYLAETGAAVRILQDELPRHDLAKVITELFDDPHRLAAMAKAAAGQAMPEAARDIAAALLELAAHKGGAR
jgi:UDP-N-acetylglucosamine--N-acetylmuramyl-(pentapeptide) pyrophosphoryl-undecaprenol N-acetylglucosamine transferase